jgi:exodeoxyribonuclease VII small subunit
MAGKKLSLEESMNRLAEILKMLESGEKSLEESIKLFEEGMKISKDCQTQLQSLENRVKVLIEKESGEIVEENMEGS